MSEETGKKEKQKQIARQKKEHIRYLERKYGRELTAKELRLTSQNRL